MTTRTISVLSARTLALLVPLSVLGFLGCGGDDAPADDDGTETGDGDGDPTGDGDGDPTGDGDGDGDPTGDGDGEADPVCGNGELEGDEQCDDGNDDDDDACTNECTLANCGDGVLQPGEECDSGENNGDTAACTSACKVNVCGDSLVGPGEGCDDGNDDNEDGCTNVCSLGTCGDSVVEGAEVCDDGNMSNLDACLDTCVAASCGDEFVFSDTETCDLGAQNSDTGMCTSSCQLAECGDGLVYDGVEDCDEGDDNNALNSCLPGCILNECGDGFEGPDEECDDGNEVDDDGCSNICELVSCGNGTVESGEACDDGNQVDDDECTNSCDLPICGDEILQTGEECDLGFANDNGGACTDSCKLPVCGDGFQQGDEACDDGNDVDTDDCTSACELPACGDTFVQESAGEECEPPNSDTCDEVCKLIPPNLVEVEILAQNFDGLPTAAGGSDLATFQAALANWAFDNANDSFRVGDGTGTNGGIFSFGTTDAAERALGGQASGNTESQVWGVCITNGTANDYTDVTVSYVGEQWRDGGVDTASKLTFAYTSSPTIAADLATNIGAAAGNDAATGWLEVAALDFTGPIATTTAGALDGNLDANKTAVTAAIPDLVVAANATVCIRWMDLDDTGSDHALSIDDLVVDAMTPG